ncbi:MAG: winged helix-turn-helix transcriptional regulator [Gemmatimonadales bacterium]
MAERYHPVFCSRFHRAIELIGSRWSGTILNALLGGPLRYAELRHAIPDITDRMLSERLKELEQEGIVKRRVEPETPVRVEYELTAKGRALEKALRAVAVWAEEWIPAPVVPGRKRRSA